MPSESTSQNTCNGRSGNIRNHKNVVKLIVIMLSSYSGSVAVGVPHDCKDTPVDDVQNYDSTQPYFGVLMA